MSKYIIRGVDDTPDIPFQVLDSLGELSSLDAIVLECDFSGTDNNPVRILNANGGYMETYTFGGVKMMRTKEMTPSSATHGITYMEDYAVVVAYSIPNGNNGYIHRVLWKPSNINSATQAVIDIKNGSWSTDNVLYNDISASEQIPSFVVEAREWDETPSEDVNDPTNVLPQGGEYAELGIFDETDNIGLTDLPNPDATMNMSFSSFVTCFLLDTTSMQGLGTALFNASFWSNLKSKFEGLSDPLSMILACHQIPLNVSGTTGQFQIGGVVPENNGNPVPATRTGTRYVKLPMGTVNLKEIFGSEKDYSNVSIQIYLPYVGMRDIDPDLAVGNALTLVCYVDIWTGDVLYLLHVSNATRSKKYFTSETVPYRWSGNCAKGVPLGRVDNSRMIMNMVTTVASVGAGLATMGVGSVGAIGGGATATATGAETVSKASNVASIKEGAKQVGGAVTEAVSSSKLSPIVQSSGGIAGSVGHMDLQSAYIIVKRGVPKYPNDWRTQFGAPNYQTLPVASLSGYTKFSTIHLENMGIAVAEEISELERLITTEGIIL